VTEKCSNSENTTAKTWDGKCWTGNAKMTSYHRTFFLSENDSRIFVTLFYSTILVNVSKKVKQQKTEMKRKQRSPITV